MTTKAFNKIAEGLAEAIASARTPLTPPRPIVSTPQPRNGGKWWEVALDNGRCYAFETQAQAKKFIRENRI